MESSNQYSAAVIEKDTSAEDFFRRPFKDVLPKEEKERIFGKSANAVNEILKGNGVDPVPDILSRLNILGDRDYIAVEERTSGFDFIISFGVTTRTGLAFVCMSEIQDSAKKKNVDFIDQLRTVGVHELAHVPEYTEEWINNAPFARYDPYLPRRRSGIRASRPKKQDNLDSGLRALNESAVEIIARKALERAGEPHVPPRPFTGYGEEVKITEMLMERVGIGPFVRALYTKRGLRELVVELEKVYGKGSFRKIVSQLGEESNVREEDRDPQNPYPLTTALLQGK